MSRLFSFNKFAELLTSAVLATFPSFAYSADLSGHYMIPDPQAAGENSSGTLVVTNGEMSVVFPTNGMASAHSPSAKYRVADKAFLDGLRNEMKTNFRYSDADGLPLDCLVAEGIGAVCKTDARPRTGRQFEINLSTGYFFFTWAERWALSGCE